MDCPLLVWMLTFNRELTAEVSTIPILMFRPSHPEVSLSNSNGPQEYDKCYQTMRECVPHANVPYAPQSQESRCACSSNFSSTYLTSHSEDGVLYASAAHDASQTYPSRQVEGL